MTNTPRETRGLGRVSAIGDRDYAALLRVRLDPVLTACTRTCQIDPSHLDDLCRVYLPLAAWIDRIKGSRTLVLGVTGAPGSGKSTLSTFLTAVLSEAYGYRVAAWSIDDLYLTQAERRQLASRIHPLLKTRGAPGTHDIGLGLSLMAQLTAAGPDTLTRIPVFNKALDERSPEHDWPVFRGAADIILLEGWCLGAAPQSEAELVPPVNDLEAAEDPDGTWRRYVNARLALEYAQLFARLDRLIMLKVPGMASVYRWRGLQEAKLVTAADRPSRIMEGAALRRFIMHFERVTRTMLLEMPQRADVVLELDEHQRFTHIGVN